MKTLLENELHLTAEMLVDIASNLGIYYAITFLRDTAYDRTRLSQLLPILQEKPGAIKTPIGETNDCQNY